MDICIPSTGPTLDSLVDPRFGRAAYFLILDSKGKIKESIENQAVNVQRGAGVLSAQTVAGKGIGRILVENIGPMPFHLFYSSGIKVMVGPKGLSVKDLFKAYKDKKTKEVSAPTIGGFRAGRGQGRGRGS